MAITLEIHYTTLSPIFNKTSPQMLTKKFEDTIVEDEFDVDLTHTITAQEAIDEYLKKWHSDGFYRPKRNPEEIIPFHCITAIFQHPSS